MILFTLTLAAHAQTAPEPAAPPPTPTEADQEQARLLYTNGARLYEEGQYAAAIQAFRESYALSKNHKLLLNIANALERTNELQETYDTLTQYRIYATPEEADTVSRRLRGLELRLDEQRAAAAAAARAAAAAATPAPVAVAPAPVLAPVPTTTTVPNVARWTTIGIGAAATMGFGAVAGFTYSDGRTQVELGEQAAYERLRPLNNAAFVLSLAGLGVGVVGFALPATRTVPITTTFTVSPSDFSVAGQF
jgi:hypothetical protein